MKSWLRHLPDGLLAAALVATALLVFHPVLTQFFAGTDTFSLIETGRVGSLRDLGRILVRPLMAGTGFTSIALYYRPVSSLSFGLDFRIWGLQPGGYYLTNLLLHTFNALLVFYLLRAQGRLRPLTAWIGAMVFLLHPVTVETVPVLPRRQDMLALFFGLLALVSYRLESTGARRSRLLSVISVIFFGLALLSKEVAAVFAVLIPADRFLARDRQQDPAWPDVRQVVRDSIPYVAVLILFLLLRLAVLGGMGGEVHDAGVPEEGALARSLVILPAFFGEIIDPAKILESSQLRTWALPLAAAVLCFSAAAGILLMTPQQAARPNLLSGWRPGRKFALGALVASGLFMLGYSIWQSSSSPAWPGLQGFGLFSNDRIWALAIGLVLAVILAGIVMASRRWDAHSAGSKWRMWRLAYYGLWILLPLAIYSISGTFSARLAYFPSVGVVSILAGVVDAFADGFASRDYEGSERLLVAGSVSILPMVLFLTAILLAASPLVKGLGEWPAKARLGKSFFAAFEQQIGSRGPCKQITLRGFPERGVIGLDEYGVQSWTNLRYPGWDASVDLVDRISMDTIPSEVILHSGGCVDGTLQASVEVR